eukprot:191764_1
MTSLLKKNLHQMVDFASANKITACIGREDVCRFLLHSYMDYMTDHGLYDSSFEVLIDWSKQLNVNVDEKQWKITKPKRATNPLFDISRSHSQSQSGDSITLKRHKRSTFIKKKDITPSNSVPVTPKSDTDHRRHASSQTNAISKRNRVCSYSDDESKTSARSRRHKFVKYKLKLNTGKATAPIIILQSRRRAKSHGTWIKMKKKQKALDTSSTSPAITPHEEDDHEVYNWAMASTNNKRRWTNDSEVSEWNLTYQREWSDDDLDEEDTSVASRTRRDSSASLGLGYHDKNLIVTHHAKNILSNIDEDEKYILTTQFTHTNSSCTYDEMHSESKPMDYVSSLSHSIWLFIAQFLDTSSKAAGLGSVNREMNLLCSHPICWKKLRISIDALCKISLNVMRRSFKCLTRFELNWNNPETPLSLLYGINRDHNHINNRINGYMALKYSKEIELFFSNLSSVCNASLHTFKLSMHGGPYRLANSAPTSTKIFQTETLLRLVFSNFTHLRKFKMDAYNLIAVDVFTSLLKKYSPKLQFFESQIVVYDRQQQRVILENPVLLRDVNILPVTLRHLCLPLLADDSWIINQHLPNLEYLFFFGYTRSSGYALHENFLSIRCLDYIAGQKSPSPNCPRIKIIEIALRQNDYLTIILRPIIRKLFLKCHYLQSVKLATAGNLDLAQSLYKSLYASNLGVCHVFAKDEGRPEKPIGVVEFRRNTNYKFQHHHKHSTQTHLSVPTLYKNEETVSEMAIGGRLRG